MATASLGQFDFGQNLIPRQIPQAGMIPSLSVSELFT